MNKNIFAFFVTCVTFLIILAGVSYANDYLENLDTNTTITMPLNITNQTYGTESTGPGTRVGAGYGAWDGTYKFDAGISLDGTGDYMNVSHTPDEFKFYEGGCFWYWLNGSDDVGAYYMGAGNGGGGTDDGVFIARSGSNIFDYIVRDGGAQCFDRVTNATVLDGNMHFHYFCWDTRSNGSIHYYVDEIKYHQFANYDDCGSSNVSIRYDMILGDLNYGPSGRLGAFKSGWARFGFVRYVEGSFNPYNSSVQAYLRNSTHPRYTAPVLVAPNITKINFTLDGGANLTYISEDNWTGPNTTDTTPTYVLVTDVNSFCRIDRDNQTYDNMNCTATSGNGTTSSTLTLCADRAWSGTGYRKAYVACCDDAAGTTCESPNEINMNVSAAPTVVTLNITTPTTASPASVNGGDNMTIYYLYIDEGVNVTSEVSPVNVTVGSSSATLLQNNMCEGTPPTCTSYDNQSYCSDRGCDWGITTLYIRSANNGSTASSNPDWTNSFSPLPNTSYAPIMNAQDEADSIWSLAYSSLTKTSFKVTTEDDTGAADGTTFEYIAIANGEYVYENFHIKCHTQNIGGSQTFNSTFVTPFPNSSFVVIASPGDDTDSPNIVTIARDPKWVYLQAFDDINLSENVWNISYCAFSLGDRNLTNEIEIKTGSFAASGGATTVNLFDSPASSINGDYVLVTSSNDACVCQPYPVAAAQFRNGTGSAFDCDTDTGAACASTDTVDYVMINERIEDTNFSSCSGTHNACSTFTPEASCDNVSGCSWNDEYHNAWTSVGWELNVTVPDGLSGLQDLNVTATNADRNTSGVQTNSVDYGAADTCTYGGSGNWSVTCGDNCTIESPVDLDGNSLIISGKNGQFKMTANITNFEKIHIGGANCNATCNGGCFSW